MLDSKIKDALDASDKFMDDISERLAYVNREMALMDYKSDTEGHYRDGFADGKAEGIAEGKAEGIAEGIAEERTSIVKEMIKNGLDDETIFRIAKISPDEIQEIRRKIKL